jgi:hypothetical protein
VVTVLDGGEPVTTIACDGSGDFAGLVPAGRDLSFVPAAPGRVAVAGEHLVLSRAGALAFTIRERRSDGELVPSPGKLTISGLAGSASPDLGPVYRAAGAGNVVASARGEGQVVLAPGRYVVHVSRGPEFDLWRGEITVLAGQAARIDAVLNRVVDTSGAINADFHQHQIASPDAAISLDDRVTADLAEGLELVVASDHNQITDLAPAVLRVRGAAPLATVVGLEATTETIGHFHAYPVPLVPRAGRGGAPPVNGRPVADLFAALRQLAPELVLQVNHPRATAGGYFSRAGLPIDPVAPLPAGFDTDFDALEVLNGKRVGDFDQVLADWLGLLARGLMITATGGSDSHAVLGQEAGYPRVWLGTGDDDPLHLDAVSLVELIKHRRDIVVSNGPYVTWRAGGQSIIGAHRRLGATGATIATEITVQAPAWIGVDRVEVWKDQHLAGTLPISGGRNGVGTLRITLPWSIDAPGIYVVVVRGSGSLAPVVPDDDGQPVTPIAVTNPLWVK